MQTVNFHCGHCQNVMAVSEEHLGQEVQCPHCQQVVVAPAPAAPEPPRPRPAPATEPMFTLPSRAEQESIFGPPEDASDDLFGAAPPKLDYAPRTPDWMRPEPAAVPPPTEGAPVWMESAQVTSPPTEALSPEVSAAPLLEPTITVQAPPPAPPTVEATAPAVELPAEPAAKQPPPAPPEPLFDAGPPLSYASRRGGGWAMALLIVPLISYSILSTVAVGVLYMRPQPPHPLEALPDNEGEDKGVKRKSPGNSVRARIKPDEKLPDKLRVSLGQSITLGAIEVTPERVERGRVRFFMRGSNRPDEARADSLVLHLRLKNVSDNLIFCPTDPVFDRKWSAHLGGNRPYTFLEVGNRAFYGGADTIGSAGRRETAEGQTYGQPLQPGEELTTVVCTDPDDRVADVVAKYDGPLLWRVQVRRGLVPVGSREVPATAVVGVVFSKDDIQKGG